MNVKTVYSSQPTIFKNFHQQSHQVPNQNLCSRNLLKFITNLWKQSIYSLGIHIQLYRIHLKNTTTCKKLIKTYSTRGFCNLVRSYGRIATNSEYNSVELQPNDNTYKVLYMYSFYKDSKGILE